MEDKILFEQAYSTHGKSFKRIQKIVSVIQEILFKMIHNFFQ